MLERAIKSYDIRGIFQQDVQVSDFARIAQKLCTYVGQFQNKVVLVIGHDARPHAQACYQAAIKGAQDSGAQIVPLGLVATPMLLTALYKKIGTCGLMITASHNPEQYAGAKLYIQDQSISGKELRKLMQVPVSVPSQLSCSRHKKQAPVEVSSLFLAKNKPEIQGMSLACDVSNSALQGYIQQLAQVYGLRITVIQDPDRGYDPTHPVKLQKAMQSNTHQLGLAFDGDADRVVVVLPGGRVLGGDEMTALFAWYALQTQGSCRVVLDQKISPVLQSWLEQQGAQVYMSQTGCMHIKKRMKEVHAHLGGEMSGHYFFTQDHPGFDDAWYAAMQAACMVSVYGSTYVSTVLPRLHESKELRISGKQPLLHDLAVSILQDLGFSGISLDLQTGIRHIQNGVWIMMRFSQTEPVLCVRFGAQQQEMYTQMSCKVQVAIQNHTRNQRDE